MTAPLAHRWMDRAEIAPIDPSRSDLARLVRRAFALGKYVPPVFPEAVSAILELPDDANFTQVAMVLETDLALSGRVLRVANSPFYVRHEPAHSLEQAIGRLGIAYFREVVVYAALEDLLYSHTTYEAELHDIRDQSILTARVVRMVAERAGLPAGALPLAGLFHESGLAGSLSLLDAAYDGRRLDPGTFWEVLLDLGPQTGWHMAMLWELPPPIPELVVARGKAEKGPPSKERAVLTVAIDLVNRTRRAEVIPRRDDPDGFAQACFILGLAPSAVGELAEAAAEIAARAE